MSFKWMPATDPFPSLLSNLFRTFIRAEALLNSQFSNIAFHMRKHFSRFLFSVKSLRSVPISPDIKHPKAALVCNVWNALLFSNASAVITRKELCWELHVLITEKMNFGRVAMAASIRMLLSSRALVSHRLLHTRIEAYSLPSHKSLFIFIFLLINI